LLPQNAHGTLRVLFYKKQKYSKTNIKIKERNMPRISSIRMIRSVSWLQIIAMTAALLLPLLVAQNNSRVNALQLTERVIEMQSSEAGVENDYVISFDVDTAAAENIGAFRVEFCDNNPIPNETCTFDGVGDDIPQVDANAGNIATLNGTPTFDGEGITMTAPAVGDHYLTFILDDVTDPAGPTATFSVQVNDINNPSNTTDADNNNTFYARVYAYNTVTPPAGANPMPTTNQIHEGGVALSTAEVITIDARVQEILDFCVGTQIVTVGDCSTISGNSIDLGVLDQTAVTRSSALNGSSGTCDLNFDECAILVVTTNATADGVAINYRAQGFDVGTTCPGGTTAGGPVTDQCLNPVHESAQTTINAASEAWGIAVINSTAHSNSTTSNLTRANDVYPAYNFASNGYAVNDGDTPIPLAQSDLTGDNTPASRVVDREQLEVEIAASAAYTTPSGAYQTTLEFIATGTF